MDVTFAPRGIVQIDNARITHRNFSGIGSRYNREGDRNFALIIPDPDIAERLSNDGWNVKIRPARDPGETPFMYLPVKIKFNERTVTVNGEEKKITSPNAQLVSNGKKIPITEGSINIFDNIDIDHVDLDIRPYDWEMNGETGRTAYLQGIRVTQRIDRFSDFEYPEE